MAGNEIKLPYPTKQIAFHQLLVAARTTVLHRALADALSEADPQMVAKELNSYVSDAARQLLAKAGIRDEHVFATPAVLTANPMTLGYYRLLLGAPMKQFYRTETGLSQFKPMEAAGRLTPALASRLGDLCVAMNDALAELVMQITPEISRADVDQLPLLTLGVQFDGRSRNDIGRAATAEVFLAIRELVGDYITHETDTSLTLVNSSQRQVRVALGAGPDVAITEDIGGTVNLNVAIEIKGGTDRSNAHNRAGEAEKSHQKVRGSARDFWTLIAMKGVDPKQLARESPTTRKWFDVAQVLSRSGQDWEKFGNAIAGSMGIV